MDNKTYQSIEQCYRISSYFRFACLNHGFLCLPFLSVPFPLLFFPSEGGCRRNRDWLKLTLEKGDFVVIIQFTWCPIGIAMYLIKTGTERASWIDFLRLLYFWGCYIFLWRYLDIYSILFSLVSSIMNIYSVSFLLLYLLFRVACHGCPSSFCVTSTLATVSWILCSLLISWSFYFYSSWGECLSGPAHFLEWSL